MKTLNYKGFEQIGLDDLNPYARLVLKGIGIDSEVKLRWCDAQEALLAVGRLLERADDICEGDYMTGIGHLRSEPHGGRWGGEEMKR
eukprot:m.66626 g.66626  ORF g.66626 m.66626 type:complete len:87 (+) comp13598_c0_seq3:1126-1386(+)